MQLQRTVSAFIVVVLEGCSRFVFPESVHIVESKTCSIDSNQTIASSSLRVFIVCNQYLDHQGFE